MRAIQLLKVRMAYLNSPASVDFHHLSPGDEARYSCLIYCMMVLVIACGVLISMIAYMTIVPIRFFVDTDRDLYTIFQPGVFSFRMFPLRDLGFEFRIARIKLPIKSRSTDDKKEKVVKKEGRPNKKHRSLASWRFLISKVIQVFKVHYLTLDLDTNDFVLNAYMFPIFYFITRRQYSMNINFTGRNHLAFNGSVRPISLIWAYFLFLTKK